MKIRSKTAVKGCFAAQQTRFLVVGLAVSRFSPFAPVASTKNKGLARKLDKILTCSFLFSAWLISRLFDKKAQEDTCLAGVLPDFGLDNLLKEGVFDDLSLDRRYSAVIGTDCRHWYWLPSLVLTAVIGTDCRHWYPR